MPCCPWGDAVHGRSLGRRIGILRGVAGSALRVGVRRTTVGIGCLLRGGLVPRHRRVSGGSRLLGRPVFHDRIHHRVGHISSLVSDVLPLVSHVAPTSGKRSIMRAAQPCVHATSGMPAPSPSLVDEVCRQYPRWDSNPQHTDFKSVASANWATGARRGAGPAYGRLAHASSSVRSSPGRCRQECRARR